MVRYLKYNPSFVVRWETTIRFILLYYTFRGRKKIELRQKNACTPISLVYNGNQMSETPKKRGRPKGSTSFTRVKLSDLLESFGVDACVVVSKKWMEDVGLTVSPAPVRVITAHTSDSEEPEEKIEFSVNTFD